MTTTHVGTYLNNLRLSKLLSDAELKRVIGQLSQPGQAPPDSDVVRQALLDAHLITSWQDKKLREGRHKGFFIGKYKLLAHVGTGGMGAVYLAEHTSMRRQVALKVLPKKYVSEETSYLDRFHREAQAIAGLNHKNVVRAYDVDCDDGVHFMVLEYIEGIDLEKLVKQDGPLPAETAAAYIRQAAEGLDHAHQQGMIHRDIKPGNLLVDGNGVIKVLDMGLARLTGQDQRNLTQEFGDGVLGTADYMAPEQALDSSGIDARADLYSLGGTLYFLLAGHPPFPTGTLAERLVAHQSKEPQPIEEIRDDVPPQLVAICSRMMAKKPSDRYQTAAKVRDELTIFLNTANTLLETGRQRGSTTVRSGLPVAVPLDDDDDEPLAPADETSSPDFNFGDPAESSITQRLTGSSGLTLGADSNSNQNLWIGLAAVAVVAVLAGGFLLLTSSSPVAQSKKESPPESSFVEPSVTWNDRPETTPPPVKATRPPPPPPVGSNETNQPPPGAVVSAADSGLAPVVLVEDDFERKETERIGKSYTELEPGGSIVRIYKKRLGFAKTFPDGVGPALSRSFRQIDTGLLVWEFDMNWERKSVERSYFLYLQLGDAMAMRNDDLHAGVAVNLVWTRLDKLHEQLGWRSADKTTRLGKLSGQTRVSVAADADLGTWSVALNGNVIGSRLSLEKSVKLNQFRLVAERIAHSNFSSHHFDNLRLVYYPNQVYEAEAASRTGTRAVNNYPGASGNRFVDFIAKSGESIEWTVQAPAAGTYAVAFRYALAGAPRRLELRVNDEVREAALAFPSTGDWSTWRHVGLPTDLAAGTNKLKLTSTGESGPNVDALLIRLPWNPQPSAPAN